MINKQADNYHALDAWFKTSQGVHIGHAFTAELKTLSDQLRGHHLVQLGACGENPWLRILRFRQKWIVAPSRERVNLAANINYLPFDNRSVDCVIAPLTMEIFVHARSPLDEIDRILKPMGHIAFFGINPWSFWGAALRWGRLSSFAHPTSVLSASLLLNQALLNRGYRQCMLKSFYYIPPMQDEMLIKKFEFLNEMGKMLWVFPPGFYCLIVQKYEVCSPDVDDIWSFAHA